MHIKSNFNIASTSADVIYWTSTGSWTHGNVYVSTPIFNNIITSTGYWVTWTSTSATTRDPMEVQGIAVEAELHTILEIMTDEERAEVERGLSKMVADKEKIPFLVKYLVYERIRQKHNTSIIEQQIEELQKVQFYLPDAVAEEIGKKCAELQSSIIKDAYVPRKE